MSERTRTYPQYQDLTEDQKQRNREAVSRYKARNSAAVRESQKVHRATPEYRENRRKGRKVRDRQWYAEHRESESARKKAAYERFGEEIKRKARAQRRELYYKQHQMEPADWQALWDSQQGQCYLCGDDLQPLPEGEDRVQPGSVKTHLDHDHRCHPRGRSCPDCWRGLACESCNIAIGRVGDDPDRLRRMADALEKAQLLVTERMAQNG